MKCVQGNFFPNKIKDTWEHCTAVCSLWQHEWPLRCSEMWNIKKTDFRHKNYPKQCTWAVFQGVNGYLGSRDHEGNTS